MIANIIIIQALFSIYDEEEDEGNDDYNNKS